MYRVTVVKIDKDVPFQNREYKKLRGKTDEDTEYGYVYFDDTKDVETEVYDQTVDDLDLTKVIKAVNNIEGEKENESRR